MLSYDDLKGQTSQFPAITRLTVEGFEQVLPQFAMDYTERYLDTLNVQGQPRRRTMGASQAYCGREKTSCCLSLTAR